MFPFLTSGLSLGAAMTTRIGRNLRVYDPPHNRDPSVIAEVARRSEGPGSLERPLSLSLRPDYVRLAGRGHHLPARGRGWQRGHV